jgi:hypothetical protein
MFVECRSSIDVHPQVATLGVMRRLILRRDDVNCDNANVNPETKHDAHDTVTVSYTMKYRKLPEMKNCRNNSENTARLLLLQFFDGCPVEI